MSFDLTSLVSHWKLDEASGDALDAHGSHNLTDTNTVGSAAGKIGNARDFEDANSEYFVIADHADFSAGSSDFTVTAWVKAESLPGENKRILCKINNAVTLLEYDLFYWGASSTKFAWYIKGSGDFLVDSVVPSTGTWYFVVAWYNATTHEQGIQVNNGTASTGTVIGSPSDTAAPFCIGSVDGLATTFWDGLIDEVNFWRRLLTDDEKTALYNGGAGLAYPFDGGGGGGTDTLMGAICL